MATSQVAIYLRVSTEEQRERQSIATQRDFAERYCALHLQDSPIYGWYADDGVSGTIALEKRPEGSRLLRDARDGHFREVLIYRLDRIGRESHVVLDAVKRLEETGVQVRSMTEPFDTSTPAGRLMLTMLAGFAGFEHDSIIERSVAGTNRLARAGTWLGGIVPYGYRVEGKDKDAHLVISEQRIDGLPFSEADVMRLIYRRIIEDDWSCQRIADELNALGIPPSYVLDNREILKGKRTGRTQGIWRAGRIRNMVIETTYKGLHRYGKRSKKPGREIIEREVPAIVSVETWEKAQGALQRHQMLSARNAKHQYLLRSMITCGVCGLTYCGYVAHPGTASEFAYYRCNGAAQFRGIYGAQGKRCPSKGINGTALEAVIWAEIEGFLRDPGPVLEQLAMRARTQGNDAEKTRNEIAQFQQALQGKQSEKDAVIALFRRGRIDAPALDRQLDQIQTEEAHLRDQLDAAQMRLRASQLSEQQVHDAAVTLAELRPYLDEPMTFEMKRQLVEAFVQGIEVVTITGEDGKKQARARITYRFNAAHPRELANVAVIGTDMGSSRRPA